MSIEDCVPQTDVSIFVGTDRSQLFAVPVLEHSINRHTNARVKLVPLNNELADIPTPEDIRHGPRTGFSFVRFAIPALMGYQGRAIYMDADMLVFRDICELWNWEFENHHIQIVGDTEQTMRRGLLPQRRVRQCAVMLIDCEACHWSATEIIQKLGKEYSYEQLMYEMCFLKESQIGESIPFRWNSLETYNDDTCLIHFTDMYTQPWVEPANPNGYLWINELRLMLGKSIISENDIRSEIDKGYLRPSLLDELELPLQKFPLNADVAKKFQKLDASKGFEKHREISNLKRERMKKIRKIEEKMKLNELLRSMPTKDTANPIIKIKYFLRKILRISI